MLSIQKWTILEYDSNNINIAQLMSIVNRQQ